MIVPIRTRAAFEHLARHGTRIRRPALWCNWCPDPSTTTTAVAFSLGRALGPAVTRNRLRRRLRALLRSREASLPGGALLIGVNPRAIELTFDQLATELESLLATIAGRADESKA